MQEKETGQVRVTLSVKVTPELRDWVTARAYRKHKSKSEMIAGYLEKQRQADPENVS